MDKKTTGEDNLYYELKSPNKDSEARIYESMMAADIDDTTTPATTKGMSYDYNMQGSKKKNKPSAENVSQSDTVLIRQLVFISAAVVVVASLTAAATLVLALSIMMSRNDNTGSKANLKDSEAIYGKYSHRLFSLRAGGNNVANCITWRLSARGLTHVG